MSTAKFKVGDKVRVVKSEFDSADDKGLVGVIKKVATDKIYDYLVEFDKKYHFTHSGGLFDGKSVYRWYWFSQLELVEEKPKHRFKVGDNVVALKDAPYAITTDGWKGVVKETYFVDDVPFMRVLPVDHKSELGFIVRQEYFELDKSVQPWKIVIESSGDTTTAKYIEGRTVVKTEIVKRYHTDEYSVAKAVEAVTKKLFPEEDKVEEPVRKYKVGDLVECTDSTYPSVFGKWGYLVHEEDDDTWLVDFKVEYPDCHDANCLPAKTGLWLDEDICFKKVK